LGCKTKSLRDNQVGAYGALPSAMWIQAFSLSVDLQNYPFINPAHFLHYCYFRRQMYGVFPIRNRLSFSGYAIAKAIRSTSIGILSNGSQGLPRTLLQRVWRFGNRGKCKFVWAFPLAIMIEY
jgi:hypothetical protein